MTDQPSHSAGSPQGCVNPRTEALVLLAVFDEPAGYPRASLDADLDDLPPAWVSESIESLRHIGLITAEGDRIYPSEQLQRLVALHVTF